MFVETALFHSNQYCAASACEHCDGVIRHEPRCITRYGLVRYAYDVVLRAEKLSLQEQLILHALGAAWSSKACARTCRAMP